MNAFRTISSGVLALALAAAVAVGAWWVVTTQSGKTAAEKPAQAATVGKVIKEDDLNTVALTPDAVKRLGLVVVPVERKAVGRVRVYGGEVTVPVGRAIPVAAPLGGLLTAPAGGELKAGQPVRAGSPVFQLTPLLSPDARATLSAALADATGQVNTARAGFDLAEIAWKRAVEVLRVESGSQRQVDEARTALDVARRTLDAAAARQAVLNRVVGAGDETAAPVPIVAPQDGVLRVVSARPGQTVPLGAALFEVVDLSTVWVRVPLPVGDLDGIDRARPAGVGKLSAPPGTRLTPARPAPAPPSANPLAATVDVFYELPNPDSGLTPGQRLGVSIPLADAAESLTVPWGAVVFDVHGGTWVYEQLADHKYARRRVVVRYTAGADAVLAAGPPAGTRVTATGAQELFGTETGFSK